ncbi:uncharacterized protein BX664DRAFT_303192 [Halteromyces radiatus]|uniref:uncharacterized protein n=1 Tax=Halteromyces radiatus TaxID=101107 RepID=UPI0022202402|nr:uncharacterized protein BX664DRAFT_303192 [Halteromyces radiatus]KAI8080017.1 hypothetical protein BX664DRAFT_303192 [Halteromyces radiatus]
MSLFSKLTKNGPDKTMYPWSQKKLNGNHHTVPRAGHAATALSSDNIVVYGGIHKGSTKKDISYIDTNTLSANHLTTTGDIPSPRKHTAIVAMGNFVLLYGGEPLTANDPWDPHFYLLNINNRQWTRVQMAGTIPPERSGHSAVTVGGIMYIWGGQQNGRYYNELLAFNTSSYPENPHWELVHNGKDGPTGRAGHVSVVYDNRLYVFGGSDGEHMYNDIWAFDFQTRQWAPVPAAGFIPTAREHCAAALVDDALYVLGGRNSDHQELNDLCAFRIRSQRWYMFQNMGPSPTARHSLTMTAVKEKMFVIGGEIKLGSKTDDSSIYILDSGKIKYPPEPVMQQQQQSNSNISPTSSSLSLPDPEMTHSTSSMQQQSFQRGHTPSPSQVPNISQSTPLRSLPSQSSSTTSQPPPPPSSQQQQQQQHPQYNENGYPNNTNPQPSSSSPVPGSNQSNPPRHRSYYPEQIAGNQQPPRPPRHVSTVPEAALRRPRTTSPLPNPDEPNPNDSMQDLHTVEDNGGNATERATLMREIKARDLIISEMKKKEQWWRTEVSLARKQRPRTMTPDEEGGNEEDEQMLMALGDLEDDKLKLFEQLVTVKSELRRVRANITQQAQPMSDKVASAERMRTAALQEAMYFKSKYLALKSQLMEEEEESNSLLEKIHDQRVEDIEKRLVLALAENEKNTKLLQQWQRRAQHDHAAKQSAEERAKEAHARAEEAQHAYQRGLEELDTWHARATRAEQQQRESQLKIVDLTSQLSQALQAVAKAAAEAEQHEDQLQLKISRLEAAHLKARNDAAALQQRLADAMDDIARLKGVVVERDEALQDAQAQLEDADMQLSMLREAMQQRQLQQHHSKGLLG